MLVTSPLSSQGGLQKNRDKARAKLHMPTESGQAATGGHVCLMMGKQGAAARLLTPHQPLYRVRRRQG